MSQRHPLHTHNAPRCTELACRNFPWHKSPLERKRNFDSYQMKHKCWGHRHSSNRPRYSKLRVDNSRAHSHRCRDQRRADIAMIIWVLLRVE